MDTTQHAQWLGAQTWGFHEQELVRLASPLLDIAPDVRNVVRVHGAYFQGAAYYSDDAGRWKPAPRGSWMRCMQPFTWEDAAYAAHCFRVAQETHHG